MQVRQFKPLVYKAKAYKSVNEFFTGFFFYNWKHFGNIEMMENLSLSNLIVAVLSVSVLLYRYHSSGKS